MGMRKIGGRGLDFESSEWQGPDAINRLLRVGPLLDATFTTALSLMHPIFRFTSVLIEEDTGIRVEGSDTFTYTEFAEYDGMLQPYEVHVEHWIVLYVYDGITVIIARELRGAKGAKKDYREVLREGVGNPESAGHLVDAVVERLQVRGWRV